MTLLDSSHKKCAFLEQAKTELGLANVSVVCERVEQWKPAERFDAVVSRAFADLADFVAQAQHLVAPGGQLLAMKGVIPSTRSRAFPRPIAWPRWSSCTCRRSTRSATSCSLEAA